VLIVEDDVFSARALSILLRRSGWRVEVVGTVADAHLYLDAHLPTSMILDLMLPDGEGSVILERVRRLGLGIKVAVTTASSDPDRLARVKSLRPDFFLTKPFDLAELLRAILSGRDLLLQLLPRNALHSFTLDAIESAIELRLLFCCQHNRGWVVDHDRVPYFLHKPNAVGWSKLLGSME